MGGRGDEGAEEGDMKVYTYRLLAEYVRAVYPRGRCWVERGRERREVVELEAKVTVDDSGSIRLNPGI